MSGKRRIDLNILYRGCESREGYQSKILNELYEKGIFTKCTIITQTADGQDKYPAGIYHEIPAGIGYKCRYKEIRSEERRVGKECDR